MAAFRLALSQGCQGIEFDVHFCRDQAFIVHDTNLARTHQVDLALCDIDEPLRARYELPSLMQVMVLLPPDITINIEIKSYDDAQFMREYFLRMQQFGLLDQHVVISSFDHDCLKILQQDNLPVRFGALTEVQPDGLASYASALNANIAAIAYPALTPAFVADCHARGLLCWVYTVDDAAQWEHCLQLGIDGVFSNVPAAAQHWLTQRTACQSDE
jgi:glycerophosphoryl diester phosphodiesterase